MNLIEKINYNEIKKVIEQKENLIKEAISFIIKNDNWKIEDVKDKCSFICHKQNKEVEIFCYNNIPLLEFYEPKFRHKNIGKFKNIIEISMKYKKLYQE